MLGVYYMIARVIVGKLVDKSKYSERLGFFATTTALGWLTNAHLV